MADRKLGWRNGPRSPGVTTVTTEEVVLSYLIVASRPFLVVSSLNEKGKTKYSLRFRSLLQKAVGVYRTEN